MLTTKSAPGKETSRELSSPEHHILQQLRLWQDSVASVEEFRHKTAEALQIGWNGSGPIMASPALISFIQDMEEKLAQRLLAEKMGH